MTVKTMKLGFVGYNGKTFWGENSTFFQNLMNTPKCVPVMQFVKKFC